MNIYSICIHIIYIYFLKTGELVNRRARGLPGCFLSRCIDWPFAHGVSRFTSRFTSSKLVNRPGHALKFQGISPGSLSFGRA